MAESEPHIAVVGAGLTGLSAAIAAREEGAAVTVLEKGAEFDVGGNASFSGGLFMFSYDGPDDITALAAEPVEALQAHRLEAPAYAEDAYVAELLEMSGGRADVNLARALAERSRDTMHWLARCGVPFEFTRAGAHVRDGVLGVLPGQALQVAGEGYTRGLYLIRPLLRHAESLGVRVRYAAPVVDLLHREGRVAGVVVTVDDGAREELAADAVVIASGGYQASRELRREHLGPEWEHVRLRGTRHSDGGGTLAAVRAGAATSGDWTRCHSAAVHPGTPSPRRNDAPSPPALHGFWLGVMVNRAGERFVDEGPGLWARNYSKMGKAIMSQPGAEAFQVFDQRTAGRVRALFTPTVEPVSDPTVAGLAAKLDLPPDALESTIAAFGRAVSDDLFDPGVLDGKHTVGIEPPKSNWANPLDSPPFVAYHAVAGLTFTFAGLRIDPDGHVLDDDGEHVPGLYGGGEAAGGLFFGDYPAGAALMRAAVFGRTAGRRAATEASTR